MENNNFITTKRTINLPQKAVLASISILVISCLVVIALVISNNLQNNYENTGGYFELNYYKVDGFSEMLNLYINLPEEIPEDPFYEILDKGNIPRDYVQIFPEKEIGYVASVPIDDQTDFSNQDVEYISFRYTPGDNILTLPMIDNVVYHRRRGEKHDFIQAVSENEYMHWSDGLTNIYENKPLAIDSYLMTL